MIELKRILCTFTVGSLLLSGCSLSAYQNRRLAQNPAEESIKASTSVTQPRGTEDVLVALALSGGGSRAAYFSGASMLRLQTVLADEEIDLLKEVDVISSVSGGSLAAAYYCISGDPGGAAMRSRRVWDEKTVKKLMSRDYLDRWVTNWFWPVNAVRFWTTAYDRTDIMAQTLEDNLFDVHWGGRGLKFRDLNPERPYLILNATDGTENAGGEDHFGHRFTFTREDFAENLNSEIGRYPISWAVMASAAFPGAFNYLTLRDFRESNSDKKRYLHLFDGGNADNLGLESVRDIILKAEHENPERYRKYIVILVDSYKEPRGVDRNAYDPRSVTSYFVDSNFMDTFDSLLTSSRINLVSQFYEGSFLGEGARDKLIFWHITFEYIGSDSLDQTGQPLRKKLNRIPTSFKISRDDILRIDQAVEELITRDDETLQLIRQALLEREVPGWALDNREESKRSHELSTADQGD